MFLCLLFALSLFSSALTVGNVQSRQSCGTIFTLCSPELATSDSLGVPSPSWSKLYSDILNAIDSGQSVNEAQPNENSTGPAKREKAFCCAMTSDCLLLQDFGIPMCWDRFTTDIFFPDGTYGTIVTGNLTTGDGDRVDLIYGNYTLSDGITGNIYASGSQTTRPDTATMSMPTPWTSSGVGSAIPATELGTMAILSTVTSVVPGTTEPPSTLPSLTITMIATMAGCGHCIGENTTIEGPTIPGSTRLPTTSIFTTGVFSMPVSGSASCFDIVSVGVMMTVTGFVHVCSILSSII